MADSLLLIDIPGFSETLSETVVAALATDIRNRAVTKVRVDTGNLKNSIQVEKITDDLWTVSTGIEYATAQEFGRPDLPKYRFTPYMRPAALEGFQTNNIRKITNLANRAAFVRNRKRERI